MSLENTVSKLELLNSIQEKIENNVYESIQKDLFGVLYYKKEEASQSRDDLLMEVLKGIERQISSQKILIQELLEWDEIGYEFLVSKQKRLYNNRIAELLK